MRSLSDIPDRVLHGTCDALCGVFDQPPTLGNQFAGFSRPGYEGGIKSRLRETHGGDDKSICHLPIHPNAPTVVYLMFGKWLCDEPHTARHVNEAVTLFAM